VTAHIANNLLSCAGQLLVANLVFMERRRRRTPVALPLGILALDMFAWNFFDFAFSASGQPGWHYLDLTFSPFSPPLAFHLIVIFVGRGRSWKRLVLAAYIASAFLSLFAAVALFLPEMRALVESAWWNTMFLVLEMVLGALGVLLLVQHLRVVSEREERSRTRIMILAIGVGVTFASTDMWNSAGVPVPRVANIGALLAMLLMAVAAMRFRFLGPEPTRKRWVAAATGALCSIILYLAAFHWIRERSRVFVVATVTVAVLAAAVIQDLLVRRMTHKSRVQSLAEMGKFAAQMAHDLKNPLAALQGAIQFLREEVALGHSLDTQHSFLDLMYGQVQRMSRVILEYQRLGRVEPVCRIMSLNQTIREVLALQAFAAPDVQLHVELADELPPCLGDPDLLAVAFENLLRNAVEALPRGGVVDVKTSTARVFPHRKMVTMRVQDSGEGMDARQMERAFDDFFTTKPRGSGLGLPFVRRVVEAHHGRIAIVTERGVGTDVVVRLPAA
jgi:two-component system sensor histidine kinase HydH